MRSSGINKTSEAQLRASRKYVENTYERMNLRVPKGEKAIIQEHAREQGESVTAFMVRAIHETMKRDKDKKKR